MQLNLARAWRSRTFDHIIGQELAVRMTKNSLYLGHYFPLYIFAGQRGCGKTSMARLFAAALNCESLPLFQKLPKNHPLPCQSCGSCLLMVQGNHPDFIEIDGASHTGVDTIRTLIDASTLLPVLGSKRIYLIDEAHMLSKAAFNAFLKVLEEPPAHLHFILATTEITKIIDTVRSRSFQIFFNPVAPKIIAQHLTTICEAEKIQYTPQGLFCIAQETQGSVRDAINLLEQVRFATPQVTPQAVHLVLGRPTEETVLQLLGYIIEKNSSALIQFLTENSALAAVQPYALWQALVLQLQAILLKKSIPLSSITLTTALHLLEQLYKYELMLMKTTQPRPLIEIILLKLCGTPFLEKPHAPVEVFATQSLPPTKIAESSTAPSSTMTVTVETDSSWSTFLKQLELLNDPLVYSMFQQSTFIFEESSNSISITFPKELSFFNEVLESTKTVWHPLLLKVFGDSIKVTSLFGQTITPRVAKIAPSFVKNNDTAAQPQKEGMFSRNTPHSRNAEAGFKKFIPKKQSSVSRIEAKEPVLDVSDSKHWPQANNLLTLFPGTITIIQDTIK